MTGGYRTIAIPVSDDTGIKEQRENLVGDYLGLGWEIAYHQLFLAEGDLFLIVALMWTPKEKNDAVVEHQTNLQAGEVVAQPQYAPEENTYAPSAN